MAFFRSGKGDGYHPEIPKLVEQLEARQIGRRDFLRTATLLGMSATTAYAIAGKVMGGDLIGAARAQTPKKGVKYQYFMVPTNFEEDRWVQAAEARPGNRAVVHHIIVYVFDKAKGKRQPSEDRIGQGFLTAYAPGELVNEERRQEIERLAAWSSAELNLRRIGWIFDAREQMLEFNVPVPLALESMMLALKLPDGARR